MGYHLKATFDESPTLISMKRQKKCFYIKTLYTKIRGGARGVMVIVTGNGHDTSSNPG